MNQIEENHAQACSALERNHAQIKRIPPEIHGVFETGDTAFEFAVMPDGGIWKYVHEKWVYLG